MLFPCLQVEQAGAAGRPGRDYQAQRPARLGPKLRPPAVEQPGNGHAGHSSDTMLHAWHGLSGGGAAAAQQGPLGAAAVQAAPEAAAAVPDAAGHLAMRPGGAAMLAGSPTAQQQRRQQQAGPVARTAAKTGGRSLRRQATQLLRLAADVQLLSQHEDLVRQSLDRLNGELAAKGGCGVGVGASL